jgi:sugar lactone lactonase YvrE
VRTVCGGVFLHVQPVRVRRRVPAGSSAAVLVMNCDCAEIWVLLQAASVDCPPALGLSSCAARLTWLRACCAVAEGAEVPPDVPAASPAHPPCVRALLVDPLHRLCSLGGRAGFARSLGSVYGGCVTRFLGGSFRGVASRDIDTPQVSSRANGIAVTRDGSRLLVLDYDGGSHTLSEFRLCDGARLRVLGGPRSGRAPLQFKNPCQVWVAPDDTVFVADSNNHRVQVLSSDLAFKGFLGLRQLERPVGVCANNDVVVVTENVTGTVWVYRRDDGTVLRRFSSAGSGDGQLNSPRGVCFLTGDRRIAVADCGNHRVSLFALDTGAFLRHVGDRVLKFPTGAACSPCDELVVSDRDNYCMRLFSDTGDLLLTFGSGMFTCVTLLGSAVVAHDHDNQKCVVFN